MSVRRPTEVVSARARARDAAKTKKEEDRSERREEVRRLKALKRQEVEAKLLKLVEAAGEGAVGLEEMDLEGDWDPEAHDAMMKKVYGDEYAGGAVRLYCHTLISVRYADLLVLSIGCGIPTGSGGR